MSKKPVMLECQRPNGETIVIPEIKRDEIAKMFRFSSTREHYKYVPQKDGTLVREDYVREVKENKSAHVITDELPGGLECMACGGIHTSKSKLRQCYKAHGKIEVGNDTEYLKIKEDPEDKKRYEAELEASVAEAYRKVLWDESNLDELTKERCKIVNKQIRESHDNRERDAFGNLLK